MKSYLLTTGAALALMAGVGLAIAQVAAPAAPAQGTPAAQAARPPVTVESLMAATAG